MSKYYKQNEFVIKQFSNFAFIIIKKGDSLYNIGEIITTTYPLDFSNTDIWEDVTSEYEGEEMKKEKQDFKEPAHYRIANTISTKPLIDLILNSEEIEQYNLTPSQYFDLGNWLKYSFRITKKNQLDEDRIKILHYDSMIENGFKGA